MSGPPPDRLHGWRQSQQDAPMTIHRQSHTAVDLLGLDHVALALEDPEAMAAFLCEHVGMQELARGDGAIVVGAAGERGARLELLQADGPREPGALARLVLRVSDLRRAAAALPEGTEVDDDDPEFVRFTAPEGLRIDFSWMIAGIVDYDLDDVVLHVSDSEDVRVALSEVGCVPRGDALHIGDKGITLEELSRPTDRPMLDHIAVRVNSIEAVETQARARGLEVHEQSGGDAFSIVIPGPERLRLDFVE
jgi:catechol 2,3-dioxygenase-like lactoylglutathione lyase family enzyme